MQNLSQHLGRTAAAGHDSAANNHAAAANLSPRAAAEPCMATRDTKPRRARIDPRVSPLFSNLQKFSKSYSKLLEKEFSSFSKKTRIASHFSKQLEMLLKRRLAHIDVQTGPIMASWVLVQSTFGNYEMSMRLPFVGM